MGRRLSPQQLNYLHDLVHNKRVLDVGDDNSLFLAEEFARYAKSWTVVGRLPTIPIIDVSSHFKISPEPFAIWSQKASPEDFDLILIAMPSSGNDYDDTCVQWALPTHPIVFFSHPTDESLNGSADLWRSITLFYLLKDECDIWSRMIVFQKSPPPKPEGEEEEEKEEDHGHYPEKGQRFRLAGSFHWPGKKHGDRAPVVEILSDWKKKSGTAKIIMTGEVLHLRHADLGTRM